MPYSIKNPPAFLKNMPTGAQKIFISAFNSAMESSRSESTSFKIAFAAVKKKYHKVGENWKSVNCKFTNQFIKNKKIERIGEDEHFVQFKTVLTKVGVMNGAYKSPEEVSKMVDMIPKQYRNSGIPIINDHLEDDEVEVVDDDRLAGFVTDIKLEGEGRKMRIVGVDNVPKSMPDIIHGIENNHYRGSSIGYMRMLVPDEGEWSNEKGEGERYQFREENMRIFHHARMITQDPACEPPYCGVQKKKEGKSIKELNNELKEDEIMAEDDEKKIEKKVVKITTQEIGVNDMSLETVADANPAVKAQVESNVTMKKELEDLKTKVKEFEEKATKFDETEKKAREEGEKKLEELYPKKFSDEEKTGMTTNEIKRLNDVAEEFKKTPGTGTGTPIALNDKALNREDIEEAMATGMDHWNPEKKCWERPGYDA